MAAPETEAGGRAPAGGTTQDTTTTAPQQQPRTNNKRKRFPHGNYTGAWNSYGGREGETCCSTPSSVEVFLFIAGEDTLNRAVSKHLLLWVGVSNIPQLKIFKIWPQLRVQEGSGCVL